MQSLKKRERTLRIPGAVDTVMASEMEMGLESDGRYLIVGNGVLLNGVRYIIHRRMPEAPNPGANRVWLWLIQDKRTRTQRRLQRINTGRIDA